MKPKLNSLPVKLCLIAGIILLLLIPLSLVKNQIWDRQTASEQSIREVSDSWGRPQTLSGPTIRLTFLADSEEKGKKEERTVFIYPRNLTMNVQANTQLLHRSIYDIMVYKSKVEMIGDFVIPSPYSTKEITNIMLFAGVSDIRGIEGQADFSFGEETGSFQETTINKAPTAANREGWAWMNSPVQLGKAEMDGKTAIPFQVNYTLRGSSHLLVKPYGEKTEVHLQADCPNPSFIGDFLPTERSVNDEGFTATWYVSKINRGEPDACSFGVKMLQDITQYQQSMRSAKYGILVILLIFLAALAAELITGKDIHPLQYAIVGLSIVLFYAMVLSFSEFMSFSVSYLLAALLTVTALTCYFRAILKNSAAYVLGALSVLAFGISYVLLQMENYAFLCGTLLLFVLLAAVMYFTRNLPPSASPDGTQQ